MNNSSTSDDTKKMNILYVVNSGKPGGVEQHVLDLTIGLVKKGHNVFVCCNKGVIADWYKNSGATVLELSIKIDIDPVYILKLAKFIRENNITVVHTHELKAGFNGVLAAKLAGVKKIFTHIHTPMSEWRADSSLKKIMFKIESKCYSSFVNMFSTCELALTTSRKDLKIKEGIRPDKLKIIPNAIYSETYDISSEKRLELRSTIVSKFKIPEDALIIGTIGRLSIEKGNNLLVNAFAKIFKEYQGAKPLYLLLAGGGELQHDLEKQAKDLSISDRVVITGIFTQKDKINYYSALDLFAFTSLAEGFGIVFLEGMSAGLPTIASDLPVLKEVGCNKVLYFRSGDYLDLSEKINYLLNLSSEERSGIGMELKKHVQRHFSMQEFIESYINLYTV